MASGTGGAWLRAAESSKAAEFARHGAVVLPELLGEQALTLAAQYLRLKIATGALAEEAGGPGAFAAYADTMGEALLSLLTPCVARLVSTDVVPSYSYTRVYRETQTLPAHVDRGACEYTMTVAVAGGGAGARWPICWSSADGSGGEHPLQPGDAVLMRGREVRHWRDELVDGWAAYAFLFWTDADVPRAQWYDGREGIGHSSVRR